MTLECPPWYSVNLAMGGYYWAVRCQLGYLTTTGKTREEALQNLRNFLDKEK